MATASLLRPLWKAGRYPELDGLRAVAVLLVILTHILQSSPGLIWPTGGPEWTAPLNQGWMGVDLFFVLSGYLVGGQIYRRALEGRFDFREFYLRRAWRILPAYFCLLALLTGIAQISPAAYRVVAVDPFAWRGLIKNAALVTDYAFHDMGIRSWSLSVEEQFYWLAPWLLLGIARLGRKWQLPALIGLFLLAVGSRAWSYHAYGLGPDVDVLEVFRRIYLPFHSRLDGLIAGIAVAVATARATSAVRPPQSSRSSQTWAACGRSLGLVLVGTVAMRGGVRGGFFAVVLQYALLSLGFAAILVGVLGQGGRLAHWLRWRGWTPVARLSYSLYLTQFFSIRAVESILGGHGALQTWLSPPLMILGCLVCALPLFLWVEAPCHGAFLARTAAQPHGG